MISQGNFEFGISRIIKSLEPYEKKLGTDTWFYAKRCFLALAEQVGYWLTSWCAFYIILLTFLSSKCTCTYTS